MVFAGPASDRIFVLQIARFVVLTGPVADEIRAPFCKCKAHGIFVFQIARFVVLTGPAADEILELHFVRRMPVTEFSYSRLLGLWS